MLLRVVVVLLQGVLLLLRQGVVVVVLLLQGVVVMLQTSTAGMAMSPLSGYAFACRPSISDHARDECAVAP